MSDEFDLAGLIAGMGKEEAWEFVTSQLNPQAREQFLESKRQAKLAKLREQYDAEIAGLNLQGLDTGARIRKIVRVKSKYIDKGLMIG